MNPQERHIKNIIKDAKPTPSLTKPTAPVPTPKPDDVKIIQMSNCAVLTPGGAMILINGLGDDGNVYSYKKKKWYVQE